jgi:hypothetical protein
LLLLLLLLLVVVVVVVVVMMMIFKDNLKLYYITCLIFSHTRKSIFLFEGSQALPAI